MTRFLLLVTFTLVALAMGTCALQCTEVNKCNACQDAIDDSGSPCTWCESPGGCIRQGLCPMPGQCSGGGDGGDGSSGLSGGETAGVVIGVLVAVCCCCLCIAVMVAVTVTVVVYVVRRSSSNNGA